MYAQTVVITGVHLAIALAQTGDNPLNNFISAAQGGAAAIASANSANSAQATPSTPSSSSITSAPAATTTSAAPATSSSAAPAKGGLSNGAKIGIIVGAVVALALLLAILIGICCCLRVRKRRRRRAAVPETREEMSHRPTAPLVAGGPAHHTDHTYRQSQAPSLSQHPAMRHPITDNPFTDGAHATHDSSPSPHRSHGPGPVTSAVAGATAAGALSHHHNSSHGHTHHGTEPVIPVAGTHGAHRLSHSPHRNTHHGPGPLTSAATGAAVAQGAHHHSHSPHRTAHHGSGPLTSGTTGAGVTQNAHHHSHSPHRNAHHGPGPLTSAATGAAIAHGAHRHSNSPSRHRSDNAQAEPLLGSSANNTYASPGVHSSDRDSGPYTHHDNSPYTSSAIPGAAAIHGPQLGATTSDQQRIQDPQGRGFMDSTGTNASSGPAIQPHGVTSGHQPAHESHGAGTILPLAAGAAAGYGLHHKSHSPARRAEHNPLRQAPTHGAVSDDRGLSTSGQIPNQSTQYYQRASGPMVSKAADALAGHGPQSTSHPSTQHSRFGTEEPAFQSGLSSTGGSTPFYTSQGSGPTSSVSPYGSTESASQSDYHVMSPYQSENTPNVSHSSHHVNPLMAAGAGAVAGSALHHEHGQQTQRPTEDYQPTPLDPYPTSTKAVPLRAQDYSGSTDHISNTPYMPTYTAYQQQQEGRGILPSGTSTNASEKSTIQPHRISRRPVSQKSFDESVHEYDPYRSAPTVPTLSGESGQSGLSRHGVDPSAQPTERRLSQPSQGMATATTDPYAGTSHDGLRMLPSAGYPQARPIAETAAGGAAFMALQDEERRRRRRSSASASRSSSNLALNPASGNVAPRALQNGTKQGRRDRSMSGSRSRSRSSRRRSGGLPVTNDKDRPPTPFGLSGIGQPYEDKHLSVLQTEPPSDELRRSLHQHEMPNEAITPLEEPTMSATTHNRGYSTPPQVPSRSPHRGNRASDPTRGNSDSTVSSLHNTTSSNSFESFDPAADPYRPGVPHMDNVPPWERHKWRYSGATPPGSAGINPPPAPWNSEATPQQHRRQSPRTSIDASGRRSSRSPGTGINGQPRRLRFEDLQVEENERLQREQTPPGAFPSENTESSYNTWDSGTGVGRAL